MKNRLRTLIAWSVLSNIIGAICQWGYVLVLAKFSTSTNIGYYAFSQAIVYPLSSFFNLQLRRLQVTDQKYTISFSSYYHFAKISGILALFCAVYIGSITEKQVLEFLPVLLMIALLKYTDGLSSVFYGTLQVNKDMRAVAISTMIRSVISITLFTIIIYEGYDLWLACLAVFVVWSLVLSFYDKSAVRKYIRVTEIKGYKKREIRKIIKIGLPLGVIILLNQVHLNLPRYILKVFTSIEQVGVYAAVASLVVIGSVLMSSIGQAILPQMAKTYSQKNNKQFLILFSYLLVFSLLIGGGAVFISMIAGKEILILLYNKEFASQSELLVWVMMAGAAWYASGAFGQALTAMRKFTSQAWLTGIVVIITSTFCWWTVPLNGTIGAAQGLMAGAIVKLIMQSSQLIYYLRFNQSN